MRVDLIRNYIDMVLKNYGVDTYTNKFGQITHIGTFGITPQQKIIQKRFINFVKHV